MKRILSFLLALVLLAGIFPIPVQAAKGDKLIALTFDDGPHYKYTPQLLDGLKARGVNVTFFMLGQCAQQNLALVQRAYDEGHEIANHSWNHPELTSVSLSEVVSQINDTRAVLDKACGIGTEYLVRPPYGSTNESVRGALGAPAILWSLDTNDWQYGYNYIYNYIVSNAYNGAIILCHDIHANTIPAALDAIDTLKARGYEFVTVSELFRRRGETMRDGVRYYDCKGSADLGPVSKPGITYQAEGNGIRITITSDGAPIYYTLDNGRFTATEAKRYTGSFLLDEPTKVRAVTAYNLNGGRSEEAVLDLKQLPCAAPEIAVAEDLLYLTTATEGAGIYYTLDGTTPTKASALYQGPVKIEPGTVIRAIAGGAMLSTSPETMLYYSPLGNLFSDVLPGKWYVRAIDEMVDRGIMNGVGGYAFDPDGLVTRGMLVTLLYRYSGASLKKGYERTNPFTDVGSKRYYAAAVEWAYRNDIIDGMTKTLFAPDQSVTREQMAKIIDRFLASRGNALPKGEDCRNAFADGSDISRWALKYVNNAVSAGLLKGDQAGNLRPQGNATRAEVSTVLLRMLAYEEAIQPKQPPVEEP